MVGSGGLTFGGHSYSQREVLCHGLQVPAAEAHTNHLISRPATKRLSATGCHWQAIARGPQIAGLGWSCSNSSHWFLSARRHAHAELRYALFSMTTQARATRHQ